MDTYIPLPEAAQIMRLSEFDLFTMVQVGRIKGAKLPTGGVIVSEEDVYASLPREERPEYKQFSHLVGKQISIREASRKYEISSKTISRWADKGYIKKITEIGNKVMIDEADIAYCAMIYKENSGQGKWIFNPDGTPYSKKQ